ncbi:MAG: nucleotidyltransferase domain-containing protein [Lachnospiraceae bacterium]|nr:nucleotidyltransferase domain-containing protein [Lachnospiraceae bacterium]
MSRRIGEIYGPAIDSVILYGSYARGDQTAESDIDIAVLINDGGTEKMHDQMLSLVVDYELELEVTLSVVSVDYKNYSEWKHLLPFYKNIEKEGIVLWKAA